MRTMSATQSWASLVFFALALQCVHRARPTPTTVRPPYRSELRAAGMVIYSSGQRWQHGCSPTPNPQRPCTRYPARTRVTLRRVRRTPTIQSRYKLGESAPRRLGDHNRYASHWIVSGFHGRDRLELLRSVLHKKRCVGGDRELSASTATVDVASNTPALMTNDQRLGRWVSVGQCRRSDDDHRAHTTDHHVGSSAT